MTTRTKRRKARPEDPQCGPTPKYFGTGANIRIVTPAGSIQTSPREYLRMDKSARKQTVANILAASTL